MGNFWKLFRSGGRVASEEPIRWCRQFIGATQSSVFYFFSTTMDMSVNFSGIVESRDVIPQMLIMNVEAATYALKLRGEQGNVSQEGGKLLYRACLCGFVMAS